MSSILDALRKSEHERQLASGQSVSMLYPAEVKPDNKPWLVPTILVFAALIIFAVTLWKWTRPAAEVSSDSVNNPASTIVNLPQAIYKEVPHEHSRMTRPEKNMQEKPVPENARKSSPVPNGENIPQKLPEHAETVASTSAVVDKTVGSDPLKGLPALNITGFIHNEQSGSLAMINNQLVREGEEISPGLHLVKVLDDKAIFNYKGYEFSRKNN